MQSQDDQGSDNAHDSGGNSETQWWKDIPDEDFRNDDRFDDDDVTVRRARLPQSPIPTATPLPTDPQIPRQQPGGVVPPSSPAPLKSDSGVDFRPPTATPSQAGPVAVPPRMPAPMPPPQSAGAVPAQPPAATPVPKSQPGPVPGSPMSAPNATPTKPKETKSPTAYVGRVLIFLAIVALWLFGFFVLDIIYI